MKKRLTTYFAAFAVMAACMVMASCGLVEFETSDNGKLDGYWHLEKVDTLSSGGTADVSQQLIFWSVQGAMLITYSPNISSAVQRCVFHFSHENDTFSIIEPRIFDRVAGDPLVEDVAILAPFGINKLDESFKVEQLTGSKMTLVSENLRLFFKKM